MSSKQIKLTVAQENVQNVLSTWAREDDRFVKRHTQDQWIEDSHSGPGCPKACVNPSEYISVG